MSVSLAEAGADIVSINLPDDSELETLESEVTRCGRKFSSYACDVSSSDALRATFASIWKDGVTPGILLNCAGLNRRGKIEDMTDEKIDLVSLEFLNPPRQLRQFDHDLSRAILEALKIPLQCP
jgi:2-dehydro-3-deoxy-D-gluconate 5-dehydrogenase